MCVCVGGGGLRRSVSREGGRGGGRGVGVGRGGGGGSDITAPSRFPELALSITGCALRVSEKTDVKDSR